MCDLCNQGSLAIAPDGERTFCDCAEGTRAALEASCRLISLYSDQLAVFDRLAPLPPKMLAMRDEIWIAYNLECLARDDLHGGGKVGGDAMTEHICRACSIRHNIPRRKIALEVDICPVCEEARTLYPVIRVEQEPPDDGPWVLNIEQEPVAAPSPWVFIEDGTPEPMEMVNIAYRSFCEMHIGWINGRGSWRIKPDQPVSTPDCWCRIPLVPERKC